MSDKTFPQPDKSCPETKFQLDGKALTQAEYDAAFAALSAKARQPAQPAPEKK